MTTKIKYHTKEEAMTAVTKDALELRFCLPELQNDQDVAMATIRNDSWAFKYVSAKIKNNKYFVMEALNKGVNPWGLIFRSHKKIKSDLEVITLALEKSDDGWAFSYAKGEAALNKELAAKALVKWGTLNGIKSFNLLEKLCPSIQEFFPKECWYEKAKTYLIQLEQEKQAEMVSGGSTEEDEVVW